MKVFPQQLITTKNHSWELLCVIPKDYATPKSSKNEDSCKELRVLNVTSANEWKEHPLHFWLKATSNWEYSNDPWPQYLCKSIAIQMGGVPWYKLAVYMLLSAKRRAYFGKRKSDRNGRCIAILFTSIKDRGRCDSPDLRQDLEWIEGPFTVELLRNDSALILIQRRRWPSDLQRQSAGDLCESIHRKSPIFNNVQAIHALRLKPAIRNFSAPKPDSQEGVRFKNP